MEQIYGIIYLLLIEIKLIRRNETLSLDSDYELHNAGMDGVKTYPIQFESK